MNWPTTWVLDEYSQEQLFNIAATLTTITTFPAHHKEEIME